MSGSGASLRMLLGTQRFFSDDLLKRFDKFIDGQLEFEYIYFRAIALHRFMTIFNMQANAPKVYERSFFPSSPVYQKFIPGLVSCSNLLSDVNYC